MVLLATACDAGSYRLVLVYPDQDALDRARTVRMAVETGKSCAQLAKMPPAQPLQYDARGIAPGISDVATGRNAFWVEVSDAQCNAYLTGCRLVDVSARSDLEVRIVLQAASRQICPALRCLDGLCLTPDAGSDVIADAGLADDAEAADADSPDQPRPDGGLVTLDPVADLYPDNGDWNDYVQRSDPSRDVYSQDNVACEGTEPGLPSACIHGAEKKFVVVPGHASCLGWRAQDSLDAFRWLCQPVSNGLRFVTSGLKPERGLRDLLEPAGWRPIAVQVYTRGQLYGETAPRNGWWANPVVPLPASTDETLTVLGEPAHAPGTLFTVAQAMTALGYSLESDRLGVVTLGNAWLRYNGAVGNHCNDRTGETTDPQRDRHCLLTAGAQKFLWLEVALDAQPTAGERASVSILLAQVAFSRVHRSTAIHASHKNLGLVDARANLIYDVLVANSEREGLKTEGLSSHNVLHQVRCFGSLSRSCVALGGKQEIATRLVVSAGDDLGLSVSDLNTVSHLTVTNHVGGGVKVVGDDVTIAQLLSVNNDDGLHGRNLRNLRLNNVVIGHASDYALLFEDVDDSRGSGVLLIGDPGASPCAPGSGSNPGLVESCAPAGASTHALVQAEPSPALRARLGRDDPVNAGDDAQGESSADAAAFDWTRFATFERTWNRRGDDNAVFPDTALRGACKGSETCAIHDWSLSRTAAQLLNRSGVGTIQNEPFAPLQACPAAAHGDRTLRDSTEPPNVFLVNALEILFDSHGDDDGLCESDEACLYSPNLGGAYQGSGDFWLRGPCLFQDGTGADAVTGVTLYAHLENGR